MYHCSALFSQIKLPVGTLSSSDALLRTDSLSGTDPALSDGSVGSAPSLGLSPGPPCSTESARSQDKNKQKSQMISEGVDEEGLEERVKARLGDFFLCIKLNLNGHDL